MEILKWSDYRDMIIFGLNRKNEQGSRLNYTKLAEAAGIQRTYLSKVVNKNAHLNWDQGYAIYRSLDFSDSEVEFALKCLEFNRCQNSMAKSYLKEKLKEIRDQHSQIQNIVKSEKVQGSNRDLSEYYLDPDLQILHMFLTIEKMRFNPHLIAFEMQWSQQTLEEKLNKLISLRLISRNGAKIHLLKTSLHLPAESHLCRQQQLMIRIRSIAELQKQKKNKALSFSVTFAANEEVQQAIKEKFNQLIQEVEPLVASCEGKKVFQLNFDLFDWHQKE